SKNKILIGMVSKKDSFPASSIRLKTIHYAQDSIHDFAWAADKRFLVLKGGMTLPSGHHVVSYAMFQPKLADKWKKVTDYIDSTIWVYSDLVGEYPFASATAVSGTLLPDAGGMEY